MSDFASVRVTRPRTQAELEERDARYAAIAEHRSRKRLQTALRRAEKAARRAQLNPDDAQGAESSYHHLDFVRVWNSPSVQQAIFGISQEAELRLRELLAATLKNNLPADIWRKAIGELVAQKRSLEPPAGTAGRRRRSWY